MTSCLVCIGTNYERERNLSFACNELSLRLEGIRFAPAEETAPIGMKMRSENFLNRVAAVDTDLSREELREMFKQIERSAGRTADDKSHEIVRLDIDLLTYGDELLKPADMARDYVARGADYLRKNIQSKYNE
jgi:2-amino-4-hydroxy-6-hydroxymethyldihydropteridine diphosphokinase